MKKLISILLALTMLVVPLVSSSCSAAAPQVQILTAGEEGHRSSGICKLVKFVVILTFITAVGFGAVLCFDVVAQDGEVGAYVGKKLNSYIRDVENKTSLNFTEFKSGFGHFFNNTKVVFSKNYEELKKAMNYTAVADVAENASKNMSST